MYDTIIGPAGYYGFYCGNYIQCTSLVCQIVRKIRFICSELCHCFDHRGMELRINIFFSSQTRFVFRNLPECRLAFTLNCPIALVSGEWSFWYFSSSHTEFVLRNLTERRLALYQERRERKAEREPCKGRTWFFSPRVRVEAFLISSVQPSNVECRVKWLPPVLVFTARC